MIYLCVPHIIGNSLTRVTTLLQITSIEGLKKKMGFQSHGSLNFKNFWTPNFGVLG
jgi:hypothetical protein